MSGMNGQHHEMPVVAECRYAVADHDSAFAGRQEVADARTPLSILLQGEAHERVESNRAIDAAVRRIADGIAREWGVDGRKIRQFDWWESGAVDQVQCVATPAQHFSGRGARDSNKRLWCSWTVLTGKHRIFFSGDSGVKCF
jgi:hypothetical protein